MINSRAFQFTPLPPAKRSYFLPFPVLSLPLAGYFRSVIIGISLAKSISNFVNLFLKYLFFIGSILGGLFKCLGFVFVHFLIWCGWVLQHEACSWVHREGWRVEVKGCWWNLVHQWYDIDIHYIFMGLFSNDSGLNIYINLHVIWEKLVFY